MNYCIKFYSDQGYKKLREINSDEYDEVTIAKDYILFMLYFEELFEIVKLNIYEYWNLILDFTEKYRLNIITQGDIYSPVILFNQKLANILTSFQSYQDHLSKNLKYIFNDNGKSQKYFFERCNNKYDNYFSYRFFVRLRHFVQHKGFPITGISFNSEVVKDRVKITLTAYAEKKSLLEYKKWNTIKPEIEKLEEKIDFKIYLNEFLHSLYNLHMDMRNFFFEDFTKYSKLIQQIETECEQKYYREYNVKNSYKDVIEIFTYDGKKLIEKFWLPTSRLKKIIIYRATNHFREDFLRSYTISE